MQGDSFFDSMPSGMAGAEEESQPEPEQIFSTLPPAARARLQAQIDAAAGHAFLMTSSPPI